MSSTKKLPFNKSISLILILASLCFMGGCEQDEGPLEEAGEKADEAVNDAKRKIEDASD